MSSILKQARLALGLTQAEVARELGVGSSTICNWEKGCPHPPQEWRAGLASLLRVDEGDIPMRVQFHKIFKPKSNLNDGVLRRARVALGLSQKHVAAKLGVFESRLSEWERESRHPPQNQRAALAQILQINEANIPEKIQTRRLPKPNGGALQRARLELGLSQKKLAERLGVDVSNISKWEQWVPPQKWRSALARLLQIDEESIPSQIQTRRDPKPKLNPNDGVLRRTRITLGLTLEGVAVELGVSAATISLWEKGSYRPLQEQRAMLARLLHIDEKDIPVRSTLRVPKPGDGVLRRARFERGLSVKTIAAELGVHQSSICDWEKNDPPPGRRAALAKILQIDENDIPVQIPSPKVFKRKPKTSDGVLRRARLKLGLTMKEAATKFGVSKTSIERWEKGSPHPPSTRRAALARFFRLDEDDIPVHIAPNKRVRPCDGVLRRARIRLGLTKKQVAAGLGISNKSIAQWEEGLPHPTQEQGAMLAGLLQIDPKSIPVRVQLKRTRKPKASDGVLRRARLELGLTRKEVAIELGVHHSSILHWEKTSPPRAQRSALARLLRIDKNDIPMRPRSRTSNKPGDGVLRKARIALGLTMKEVASEIGIQQSCIFQWEKGSPDPPPERREALARILRLHEKDVPTAINIHKQIKPSDGVLRRARIGLGLTQKQVAARLGVIESKVYAWEKGLSYLPRKQKTALAHILGIEEKDFPAQTQPRRMLKPNDGVLRRARMALELTQEEVALRLGVSKSNICFWEKKAPPVGKRVALARILQIDEKDIPMRGQNNNGLGDGVLRRARFRLGLTLREIATKFGITESAVARWEKKAPPQEKRSALAEFLQIEESEIPVKIRSQKKPKANDGMLRRARFRSGLTQKQVAVSLGVTESSIWTWEIKGVPQKRRAALAEFFQIEESDIPVLVHTRRVIKPKPRDGFLRRSRLTVGLTPKEVAAHLGVTPSTVYRWENGFPHPPISQRTALARLLHLMEGDIQVQPRAVPKLKPNAGVLQQARARLGLTQKQIAARLQVSMASIFLWEKNAPPRNQRAVLAHLLQIDESSLPVRILFSRVPKANDGVLRRARLALDLTQDQVASELGVSGSYLHRWERELSHPPPKYRVMLARLLQIDESSIPDYVLSRRIPKPNNGVLRRARLALGLTQKQVTDEIGVSGSRMYLWEKGSPHPPQKHRAALARLLQIDEDEIPLREEIPRVFKRKSESGDGVLRRARLALGMSQREVATELGCYQSSIGLWERGVYCPQKKQRSSLAKLLQIDEEDIPTQVQNFKISSLDNQVLRRARLAAGMTQAEVARELGLETSNVGKWEANRQRIPPNQRKRLAHILQIGERDLPPIQARPRRVSKPSDGVLRRARLGIGLTQRQVAVKIGSIHSSVSKWEKGISPPQKYRAALAHILEIDENEIPQTQSPRPSKSNKNDGVLRRARIALGLTQQQVATQCGVAKSCMYSWEKKAPPKKYRSTLADLLQINESDIPIPIQTPRVHRYHFRADDGVLRRARLALGMTQEQLSIKLGVSRGSVSQWERRANHPSQDKRVALARLLQIDESEILAEALLHESIQPRRTKSNQPPKAKPRIGDRILQRARMALGWSIQQVARRLRVSSSKIENWENESPHPPLKYRTELAQLFDLDESDILVQEKNTPVAKPLQTINSTQESLSFSSKIHKVEQNHTADSTQGVLLRARLALGLNQTQVARRVGVSHSSIYAWEMEQRRPSPKYKEALAQVLNLDVDKILATAEDPEERDEKQRLSRLLEMKEQSRILAISLQGMPKLTKGYVMLLQARKGLRLTIAKVAQVLKVSVTTVWCWENGLEPVPESHRKSLTRLLKFTKDEVSLIWG